MAKLRDVNLRFTKSQSTDVVGYRLYVELAPDTPNYESQSFDLGNPEASADTGKVSINLATLFADGDIADGVYNIGVAAIDDGENLSSMDILNNVALDFVAPDAPTETEVIRI